ncbi:GIY-YIG nuclease family protein [Spiroplasma gladiatoris]|uniref:GIY-YIG nuclease family protein n=1 Tax=Spiroplasma gladiatoris TaxID=2143 RepID=A0A4P7AKT0_9MOLU|nr:GIY-YIG nuclease family protein [Spiroplasma gladiatoris]QBQ08160.1 GIY-YIG nuclease family protein [Spiroplasma gladiatoris]
MNINNKQKFFYIKKIKNSKDKNYEKISQLFCNKAINDILNNFKIYDFRQVDEVEKNLAGVYIIFSIDKNKNLKFSYIGESSDIKKRWKTHINNFKTKNIKSRKFRTKEKDLEQIKFAVLKLDTDQNTRLKKETYYIYHFKSKFTNINTKIANMKMKCDFGHGVKRTYLSYDKNSVKFRLYIYGECRNKECNNKFLIR